MLTQYNNQLCKQITSVQMSLVLMCEVNGNALSMYIESCGEVQSHDCLFILDTHFPKTL